MGNPPGWNNKPAKEVPAGQISTKARVNLNAAAFDELVKQQGVQVKVYRTLLCPRVKSIDGAEHELECPICRGSQFYDTKCIDTMAFIQGQQGDFETSSEGVIDQFSATGTFLQGVNLQYFTLVEVVGHFDSFIERIKRQSGPSDVLKYKAVDIQVVVDYNGREYYLGNDFLFDQNCNVTWKPGKGPPTGMIYSIYYTLPLQFRAVKALHVNRFAQTKDGGNIKFVRMNEEWLLQKVYQPERKDSKGNVLSPNRIRDTDEE